MATTPALTRRALLQNAGGMVVAFAFGGAARPARAIEADVLKSVEDGVVDSYISIDTGGKVTVYSGKIDYGTGVRTGISQIVAEELSVPLGDVSVIEGDTSLTPDQGPTYGSNTIEIGGMQIRRAAATAREALMDMAADRLAVARDALSLKDGAFSGGGGSVGYGELMDGQTFSLEVNEDVQLKNPGDYSIVGQRIARPEIPGKVTGGFTYMQDFRREGMLHGAVVRPPALGASLQSVDEASLDHISDLVRIVQKGDFLAVVTRSEWSCVRAARELKAEWSASETLPDAATLWDHVRETPIAKDDVTSDIGNVESVAGGDEITATYKYAIQTHGSIGPSCAVTEFIDGQLVNWSSSQATHRLRRQLAEMFGMDESDVRCIYLEGAGCYGRNGHEDAAADSALLAREMDAPVRVQWMRHDEHGWDPKGPPTLIDLTARLDDAGEVAAWQSEFFIPQGAGGAVELVPASLAGMPTTTELNPGGITNDSAIPYGFPNIRTTCHRLETTPLRPSWIRAPGRMQNTFANESFLDEIAAARGVDPLQFRLDRIDPDDQRGRAILERLRDLAQWQGRPSPRDDTGETRLKGRGMAYVKYELRRTYVGGVADIELDRNSGDIRVTKFYVTHDCGQIINPIGVQSQIEGNVIQTTSRTLMEEIEFDRSMVTSLDWATYPILRFDGVPEVVMDLIDHPNEPPWGVGEPACAIVSAAIGNAVFDAAGIRLRDVPFKPEKVRAALKEAANG